jgi:hypothetical protein
MVRRLVWKTDETFSICGTGKRFGRYLGLFLGSKSPGHESDHSFPSRLQMKNEWISASTPHVFMECKGRI